jgi:antitoxin VapB
LAQKRQRLQEFLSSQGIDALLVSRHENIAWATAGLVDVRIGLPRETGAASLLFTREGSSYYLTTNNEAPRLANEEFSSLAFQPLIQPWYAADPAKLIHSVVGNGKVAADDTAIEFPVVSLKPLRLALMEPEIRRYRWLGENVARVVADTLFALRPGMSEQGMQGMLAGELLAKGILPSVLLTATDERIRTYRHAVPRNGVLRRFGMLNLCARRWGLSVSITRFIHFGEMPTELSEKFAAVARVNAALLHATRAGATADELFFTAQRAYAAEGYPGEEQMHHQGGATGYWEREWIARPGASERILTRQAVAWNPSLQGAKVEDTVLLHEDKLETLTSTPSLPLVESNLNGHTYCSAGVLLA